MDHPYSPDALARTSSSQREADRTRTLPALTWIALLGVDGSGKSSVLRRLAERSCDLPYQGIKVFHRRPRLVYQSSHLPGTPINHYGKTNHGLLNSAAKVGAMVLDWNYGYWRRIRVDASRGFLVIADRHSLLDMLADPSRYRYSGPSSWIRLALKLVPAPGMVLLLDAPEQVLQDRKKELPKEQIARLRRSYLRIFTGWPNCRVIDANRPLENVVSEIVQSILERVQHTEK